MSSVLHATLLSEATMMPTDEQRQEYYQSLLQVHEILDDVVEQLELVSRQNDIVIKYCRLIAEALSVRDKVKGLDAEYERNKLDLRNLRSKKRNGP